ncbi:hypothetical protein C7C46_14790 [Streptomyces tateyamensis]|uniref:DUF6542 domain-containing protein n=1 Tax=Streptomyces tateyamensis TaxID=565073 RepID=A0A2V4N5C1_9ACTN|nr:DUF6542 domain-containing protein [Streptomyces tateyamensis]PYC79131.1 hypothetical protein C7C46_14790 [Streptomyces tateyamensis]
MAGQRMIPKEAADQRRPRTGAHGPVPAPRREPDPAGQGRPGRGGSRTAGRAADRSRSRRPTAAVVVTAALGLPLLGALGGELLGSSPGPGFTVLTVLGFALAAQLARRAGWWWVLSSVAPVVLAWYAGAEYLAHREKYAGGREVAADLARWAAGCFPTMAWALGAALLVIAVRLVRERRAEVHRG